jgi:hypothetical protein
MMPHAIRQAILRARHIFPYPVARIQRQARRKRDDGSPEIRGTDVAGPGIAIASDFGPGSESRSAMPRQCDRGRIIDARDWSYRYTSRKLR